MNQLYTYSHKIQIQLFKNKHNFPQKDTLLHFFPLLLKTFLQSIQPIVIQNITTKKKHHKKTF